MQEHASSFGIGGKIGPKMQEHANLYALFLN
jgi:hypothetical protein